MLTPNAHHRGPRIKPVTVQCTESTRALAKRHAAKCKRRVRCLGPDDVPEHKFKPTQDGNRICAKCRTLLNGRLRGVSPRMYTMSCSPLE